jgi:hypothetical protein
MLNRTPRPSFKQGNGAAKTTPVPTPTRVNEPASAGSVVLPKNVVAKLGFKKVIGKPKKPTFEFQEALKTGTQVELAQRRTLMNNAASRVYNQMGTATRTHETARQALLWFNQYRETITDEEERAIADRLAVRQGDLVEEFLRIRRDKVALADELETALTKTKRDLRLARAKKLADAETAKRKKGLDSFWPEEDHPETAEPAIPVDPELILQHAQAEIKSAEKVKSAAKHPRKKAVKVEGENETSES